MFVVSSQSVTRLSRPDLEAVLDFAEEAAVAAREPERQDERLSKQLDNGAWNSGSSAMDSTPRWAGVLSPDVILVGPAKPE